MRLLLYERSTMADIGNIKPPGPVWPQPSVDKIKHKEGEAEQQRRQRQSPPSREDHDNDEDESGIDEYV